MFIKSLPGILLGLLSSIALNAALPTMTPAKDSPKPTAAKSAPSIWEQLNLSKDQKNQLQAIRTKRTKAISKVLKKDQKDIFDKLRGKRKMADILKELKLDENQKKSIAVANQQAMKDIMLILKPDQQKKLNAHQNAVE
jgi:Spy/CpxP family protein refolding chaperone